MPKPGIILIPEILFPLIWTSTTRPASTSFKKLENGSEFFGRVKRVHYDGVKTSPVDIDHSVNEDLLTNAEITNRLVHLMNYNKPSIIKCMPFQLCNTLERKNLL